MKFGQKARIIYNEERGIPHMYHGYRAMLEYYTYDVSSVLVGSSRKLRETFADSDDYALTMMVCHGWGKSDHDAVLNWKVREPIDEVEVKIDDFHMTPNNVGEIVTAGSGILLTTACWAGKRVWADAFHEAGFEWYVGSEKTSDMFSAYQFVAAFLGYLAYEVRDMGARDVSVSEAVELANTIDKFWDGASGFRAFHSNIDRDRSSPSRGRPSHPTGRTDRVSGESAAAERVSGEQ